MVQLQSTSPAVLAEEKLQELLALVDRHLTIRSVSDFLHYGIYPAEVTIDRDFLVSISYGAALGDMQDTLGQEQARMRLGEIGIDSDAADFDIPVDEYLGALDEAAKADLGFGLRDMINLQRVLAMWPSFNANAKEGGHYSATAAEIADACAGGITGYDKSRTQAILEFLELKPSGLLVIEGDSRPAKDLPVWEHAKRLTRYSIRPLIEVGDKYYWGPHSVDRSMRAWMNITTHHTLPADIPNTPTISSVLERGHDSIENSLVNKAKEIAVRFTPYVKTGVFPHKADPSLSNIGDCDVLGYLEDKNALINIESKIIDPAYSHKDLQRIQRKIFGRTKSDGSFEKGDLQRVEDRAAYLEKEYSRVMTYCGWEPPAAPPLVVSIFLTRITYWWTKFPPQTTNVNFVQVKLLDSFLRRL